MLGSPFVAGKRVRQILWLEKVSWKPSTIQSYSNIRFETGPDEPIDSVDLQKISIPSRHTLFDEDFFDFQTYLNASGSLLSWYLCDQSARNQYENQPKELFDRIKMFQILIDLDPFQKYFGIWVQTEFLMLHSQSCRLHILQSYDSRYIIYRICKIF